MKRLLLILLLCAGCNNGYLTVNEIVDDEIVRSWEGIGEVKRVQHLIIGESKYSIVFVVDDLRVVAYTKGRFEWTVQK